MESDDTAELLVEIGKILAEDPEYPLDGTLLYARLDRNMVAPAIFKDRGNHVLYRWPDLDTLDAALLDLWEAQTSEPRWSEIEYMIRDGKFDVTYTYPDEIALDEDTFARRDRVVQRYYGDKPIVYPPLSEVNDGVPEYKL